MSLSIADIAHLDLPAHVKDLVQETSHSGSRHLSEVERRVIVDYLRCLEEAERELVQTSKDAEALDKALDVDIAPGLSSRAEHTLQTKMNLCHGILSSLRRIPPEVMELVFEFYIAAGSAYEDDMDVEYISEQVCGGLSAPSNPFVLCLVCRAWKDIAMHHPAVWSTPTVRVQMGIPVYAAEPNGHGPQKHVYQVTETHARAVGQWMERVGANEWSLRLIMRGWARATMRHSTPRRKHPSDPRGNPLHNILPPVSVDNLRNLHIVHRDSMYLATGLGGSTTIFPRVRSLVVDMEASRSEASVQGYWDHDQEPIADLPSMPQLEDAVLHGMNFSTIPDYLPWHHLTRLALGGERGRFTDILKVLRTCTNLVEACFAYTAFQPHQDGDPPHSVVETASRLQKLTFIGVPLDTQFPSDLSFPALTTLTTVFKDLRPWHPANLTAFNSITDLYLESLAIDTSKLAMHRDIFAAFASITRLTLNVSLPYADLFRVLTFAPVSEVLTKATVTAHTSTTQVDIITSPGPYLPHLEELGIHIELDPYPCYRCSGFEDTTSPTPPEHSLTHMLESRTSHVDSRLKATCARLKLLKIRVSPTSRSVRDCPTKDRNDVVADRIRDALVPFEGRLEVRLARGRSDYIYERNLGHWSGGFAESIQNIRTL